MARRKGQGRHRILIALAVIGVGALGARGWLSAADHRDSMALTADAKADIADVYSFVSPTKPANLVLAMTVDGLIPPSEVGTHRFDPDVLYQWKIDNDGDAVEDLVIQARAVGNGPGQQMRFRGPVAPERTGPESLLVRGEDIGRVRVSANREAIVSTDNGISVFAGVRDDPFFFDLAQFQAIIAGQASGFRNPGVDAFAGTSVLALVIELPIARLGSNPNLRIWGTTSRPARGR
ncbi:MAG: DUF4331 family protein [Longimicrobiales bacterium]